MGPERNAQNELNIFSCLHIYRCICVEAVFVSGNAGSLYRDYGILNISLVVEPYTLKPQGYRFGAATGLRFGAVADPGEGLTLYCPCITKDTAAT